MHRRRQQVLDRGRRHPSSAPAPDYAKLFRERREEKFPANEGKVGEVRLFRLLILLRSLSRSQLSCMGLNPAIPRGRKPPAATRIRPNHSLASDMKLNYTSMLRGGGGGIIVFMNVSIWNNGDA